MTNKTINAYAAEFPHAARALHDWHRFVERAHWTSPNALKASVARASIVANSRVVFNINGNDYRLVTRIDYAMELVFIIWFGTHADYDAIDVSTVKWSNPS